MTNPHQVIRTLNEAIGTVVDYRHAHKLAYAIGMTTEIHDKAGLSDDDTIRLENSPGMLGQVTDEIMSGYVVPESMNELVGELHTQLDEWEVMSWVWDAVLEEFPGYGDRYTLFFEHREMNRWEVTMKRKAPEATNSKGEIYMTYLVVQGKATRQ